MSEKHKRPKVTHGITEAVETGCGTLYVTVGFDGAPIEVFAHLGKAGGCARANTEALGRLASLALKYGAPAEEVTTQLSGISCPYRGLRNSEPILSCPDGISVVLKHLEKGVTDGTMPLL